MSVDTTGLIIAFDQAPLRFRLHATSPTTFGLGRLPVTATFAAGPAGETLTVAHAGQPPDVGKRLP